MALRPGGEGVWELAVLCPESARYAFVAEWRQEHRLREGISARFGLPHDEAAFEAKPPPADARRAGKLRRRSRPDAEDHAAAPSSAAVPGASAPGPAAPPPAAPGVALEAPDPEALDPPPSASERLGKAEFLVEINEMSQVVSEAEGAQIALYAAPRVAVEAVEALAGDGSWGPLMLRRAETPEEEGGPEEPSVWIGDAPDFREEGSEDGAGIVLRVTRRDWRIDPYALVLDKGDPNRRPDTVCNGEDPQLPWGPAVWCCAAAPPPAPSAPFARCPDRELVLYELHVGSFTEEGTLRAAADRLGHIRDLGCTAVSIMPVQQDARRMNTGERNMWGYDIMSLMAVDTAYGSPFDLAAFVARAHGLGLAVLVDFVVNHMMWGADALYGRHYFLDGMETTWGPRPDFARPEVAAYCLAAAEFQLLAVGFDGLRVDSTKSIRKFPDDASDAAGASFLGELTALCRRHGRLAVAEDLEDGDGLLQQGGIGFHLQWDMAHFCWVYDALVNPRDEYRDFSRVAKGLVGLAPGRGHALRGRVLFMESHDTAACDRYGRLAAAVHNGKSFLASEEGDAGGGDAFQKAQGALPYPTAAEVEANAFAARRAALGLVLIFTAPGVPMLLQGQEVCESGPYKWPRGPTIDWRRVAAAQGPQAQWHLLCRQLVALRLGRSPSSASGSPPTQRQGTSRQGTPQRGTSRQGTPRQSSSRQPRRPAPLMGDGLHVFHTNGGIMAYLRWAEAGDSREEDPSMPELALVIVNCTHSAFPYYELGVPPSRTWRLALSTVADVGRGGADAVLETRSKATHNFPCSIGVALEAYSAMVLLRES